MSAVFPPFDLADRSILLTGGTGSFGHAFVARALAAERPPRRLVIFSRDEMKQWEMSQRFAPESHPAVRYFIGDVRDRERLESAMRGIDTVIHAAAMKHVPAAEYNPFECIRTNVIGAENVVQAAMRSGVERVLALSTDKAANPINLYGASKLASDKIFVAANNLSGREGCHFSVVRYGNVLGSRGSVIPFFRKRIAGGATTLPITHPEMTRFWITLEQGVDFVLSCLGLMHGGEIFVPKLPSMRIVDLARAMAPALGHEVVGIRPGEKLHEVMIPLGDARNTVELADRYVIQPSLAFWSRDPDLPGEVRPVDPEFEYASNSNDHWLTPDELLAMIETA
ncbi:UDP-N-acetylglucosamine 4,6-dehydratase (inverting) [Roseospirillum parvum]|uniref:UDP-N-acetylglucosamine 4,6-dehydratase n=1 Tax=Roseospirillum parvum TaxID=83401 RepID=A0A1G7WX62_9PROT|nr:UDP-N-acetylglucosamine 4,6-dehydratase (inverting) [Roseospirillum parvum]SDG76494.1 UDP-N-acetylglucosamine 4,6-dehydratase [Roseospirillum parvum]